MSKLTVSEQLSLCNTSIRKITGIKGKKVIVVERITESEDLEHE